MAVAHIDGHLYRVLDEPSGSTNSEGFRKADRSHRDKAAGQRAYTAKNPATTKSVVANRGDSNPITWSPVSMIARAEANTKGRLRKRAGIL